MTNSTPVISIICPCFNEQEVLETFTKKIVEILENTQKSFEIIFLLMTVVRIEL